MFIGQLFERGLAVGTKSWGPFVKAAFDEKGNPTAAAQGFASNCGVEVKDLQTLQTDKGPRLYYEGEKPGRVSLLRLAENMDVEAVGRGAPAGSCVLICRTMPCRRRRAS